MVSAIYTTKNNGLISDVWRFLSNFYVACAVCGNCLLLFLLINNNLFPRSLDFLNFTYLEVGKYNFLLNLLLLVIVPVMMLNYLLVYRNGRYEELIKQYPSAYNKILFGLYFSISFLMPIIYVLTTVEIRL